MSRGRLRARLVACVASGAVAALVLAGCTGEPEPTEAERAEWPTVAVIGDSYMAGHGVEDPAEGMAPIMADDLEMQLQNFAIGGTGYVDGGLTGVQAYDAQATLALQTDADLYVVEGAANDWGLIFLEDGATIEQLQVKVRELFNRLVEAVGTQKVVVVGPVWPLADLDPGIIEINDLLKDEALQADIPYIDAIDRDWFNAGNLRLYLSADYVHPNADGHEYLAEKIADAIREVVPAVG